MTAEFPRPVPALPPPGRRVDPALSVLAAALAAASRGCHLELRFEFAGPTVYEVADLDPVPAFLRPQAHP